MLIITSIVGLTILMVMMFLGIKYFVDQSNDGVSTIQESAIMSEESTPKVEYRLTVTAVVQEVDEEQVELLDIGNTKFISLKMSVGSNVKNAYGAVVPLSYIQPGDIVEVVYREGEYEVISMSKISTSWRLNNVIGMQFDEKKKELKVSGQVYQFTENLIIIDQQGEIIDRDELSTYDTVTLQGMENKVWSIKVKKKAAQIKLVNIPTTDGMLEIDRTRMIPLSDVKDEVEVTAGVHKIVITLKGYEDFGEDIEFEEAQTYEISLTDTKRVYTKISLAVNDSEADYNVFIDGKTYKKGSEIVLPQDTYRVTISAEGYKEWTKDVNLEQEEVTLRVNLQKEVIEEELEAEVAEEEESNSANDTYTINLSTDPVGAKVYIDGVYKGTTPYKITLPLGDYTVLFEKEGYDVYTTSIILDGTEQTSFLYVLTPKN